MQDNREKVLGWIQDGLIEEQNIAQAMQISQSRPSGEQWHAFAKQTLLWLSVICLCSGVIFFFAYNWQALTRMMRFALVESALLILGFSYLRCAANARLKVALLMAMVLLTGALLALVGQTYQTGADPWQLFVTWCLLMIPWALIGGSSIIWVFWIVLFNLSYALYIDLYREFLWFDNIADQDPLWHLALINSLLLGLFELVFLLNRRSVLPGLGSLALSNRYTQQVLVFVIYYCLTAWAIASLFDTEPFQSLPFIWLIVGAVVYRYLLQDLLAIAMISLSFLVISSGFVLRFLADSEVGFEGMMLLGACYILAMSSVIGMYLKRLNLTFAQRDQASDDSGAETCN